MLLLRVRVRAETDCCVNLPPVSRYIYTVTPPSAHSAAQVSTVLCTVIDHVKIYNINTKSTHIYHNNGWSLNLNLFKRESYNLS